jgi:hypothetical protein
MPLKQYISTILAENYQNIVSEDKELAKRQPIELIFFKNDLTSNWENE